MAEKSQGGTSSNTPAARPSSKTIFPLSPPLLLCCAGAVLHVALTVAFGDNLETCFWPPLQSSRASGPFLRTYAARPFAHLLPALLDLLCLCPGLRCLS